MYTYIRVPFHKYLKVTVKVFLNTLNISHSELEGNRMVLGCQYVEEAILYDFPLLILKIARYYNWYYAVMTQQIQFPTEATHHLKMLCSARYKDTRIKDFSENKSLST